jgi:hypothetical protein
MIYVVLRGILHVTAAIGSADNCRFLMGGMATQNPRSHGGKSRRFMRSAVNLLTPFE